MHGKTNQFVAGITNEDTMNYLQNATLQNRGILKVSGEDTVTFLQGLVSNDVSKVHMSCLEPSCGYVHHAPTTQMVV